MSRSYGKDPVFLGMIALAVILGAVHIFFWETAYTLAPQSYALIVAISNTGILLGVTCGAFLAIGRHQVLGDNVSYWIGVAFASSAVGTVFRILSWLELPKWAAVAGQLPSTRTYIGNFVGTVFAGCLVAMALAPTPAAQEGKPHSTRAVAAWPVGVFLGCFLLVAFEEHLPVLVTAKGEYTPLLVIAQGLNSTLFFSGAVLAARQYHLDRDSLLAYMAYAQLALASAAVGLLAGGNRYSLLSAVDRLIWMGVYLLMLFGLLSNYMHLLRRERQKSAEIQLLNQTLERRIAERTAELQDANSELTAFSYSVSHDLRAPLRSIEGFANILLRDYADQFDPKASNYMHRMRAASQRMGQLIEDLLMLSRLSRQELTRQPVDLSGLAESVVADCKGRDPGRSVMITIQPGLVGEADPHLAHIALENLLGNAWKYTGKTENALIMFGSNADDTFFVRDNGAGFDMAYADQLFAPFQRLHRNNEFEGTGIGLATVQRIVSRHGGRIWAEAYPNRGATFYFTFGETKCQTMAQSC